MALLQGVSLWAMPAAILCIVAIGLIKGVRVYEVFCEGAKEGFDTAVRILPYLVAMFVAIGIFRSSGALDLLLSVLYAPAQWIGIPTEVLPLALIRTLSGSGSLGYLADLLEKHGPDSVVGVIGSVMQGSTETTFYVLTVYFGAVGVSKARHAVVVGLMADAAGFIAAAWIGAIMFAGS